MQVLEIKLHLTTGPAHPLFLSSLLLQISQLPAFIQKLDSHAQQSSDCLPTHSLQYSWVPTAAPILEDPPCISLVTFSHLWGTLFCQTTNAASS